MDAITKEPRRESYTALLIERKKRLICRKTVLHVIEIGCSITAGLLVLATILLGAAPHWAAFLTIAGFLGMLICADRADKEASRCFRETCEIDALLEQEGTPCYF